MTRTNRMCMAAAFLLSGLVSGAAVAQTDISKFPLAKAVPSDVFIAIVAKANPEREYLCEYWGEVTQAFLDSGILGDIWSMITDAVPDENLDEFEDAEERFGELLTAVDWGELLEKEMIYTGRYRSFSAGGMTYEGLLAGRMSKEKAAANYAALKAILQEIEKLVATQAGEGVVVVTETKEGDLSFTTFGPSEVPDVGISIGVRKDVIMVSFGGNGLLQDAVGLLRGSSKMTALVGTDRFKQALAELPPAEDSLVFFDIEGMISPMRTVFESMAAAQSKQTTEDLEDSEKPQSGGEEAWAGIVVNLLNDISVLDYMAAVEWTEGYRVFGECVTKLKPNAKSSPLYDVIAGNKSIEKFEKYIPKEADNFSCSSGINLSKLYGYILGFAEKNVPGGKEKLAVFEQMQKEQWELDIDKDVLQLFTGSIASASMGKDWFIMAGVTDEKKMAAQVNRLLGAINGALGAENALMATEIEVAGKKGFTQISHPMMIMMGGLRPPVIGCADGYLIVGSSEKAVTRCLETGRGKHPNIKENERWRKEALVPKSGAVDSISFTDESNMAAELQEVIGAMSMSMGMVAMFAQDTPPEVRSVLSALPPLLGKLIPVAAELDFYQSSASYSSFNGSQWHTWEVQNYKAPKPKTVAPKAPSGKKSGKKQEKVGEI